VNDLRDIWNGFVRNAKPVGYYLNFHMTVGDMGKKSRKKRLKRDLNSVDVTLPIFSHMDQEGLHAFIPGHPPSKEKLDEMLKVYQDKIRNSSLWEELIEQYGMEKAEEILKQCRAEIRD
jgi:hypothetical protein